MRAFLCTLALCLTSISAPAAETILKEILANRDYRISGQWDVGRKRFIVRVFEKQNEWTQTGELPCRNDGTYATGARLRCGFERPYIEILHTFQDPKGAAIINYVDPARKKDEQKQRKYLRCNFDGKLGLKGPVDCDAVPFADERDEGKLSSPILKSSNLPIPNSHPVVPEPGTAALIFRGMEPKTAEDYAALAAQMGEILIFKNPRPLSQKEIEKNPEGPKTDIEAEKAALKKAGFTGKMHQEIPFLWKAPSEASTRDLFQTPCEQTIDALKILMTPRKRPIYFHCTVGEDRTGYLAGLYRYLISDDDIQTVFWEEMCERGYAMGDGHKPFTNVVLAIHRSVTRVFAKMVYKIDQGEISATKLEAEVCKQDPDNEAFFTDDATYHSTRFQCRTSTRFRP
jgi:hypothetical protein